MAIPKSKRLPAPSLEALSNANTTKEKTYDWKDLYPELVNKIRWAICSTLKTPGSNYPYSLAQPLATVLSGYAIDTAKQEQESPGSTQSTSMIRSFLDDPDKFNSYLTV